MPGADREYLSGNRLQNVLWWRIVMVTIISKNKGGDDELYGNDHRYIKDHFSSNFATKPPGPF